MLASLLLVACGNSDEDQVTDVIKTSATSTDPADCTKLETTRYLQVTQLAVGPDALKQCQDSAADTSDDPDSVDVKDVNVDGDNATANVTFSGGRFDGSTITVALVKVGDQWKLDRITGIPTFDVQGFTRALSSELLAQGKSPQTVITCLSQAVSKVGEAQIKNLLVTGDSTQLTALFAPCTS